MKSSRFQLKNEHVICIGTFLFFVFMMCFNLTHSALWGDEWVEYYFSQAGIKDGTLYSNIISTFQPPLYNLVMHFWLKINQSVLWFRLFNVVVGCIAGGALFLSIRKLTNSFYACISLCVLSISYRWIYCIQECSEYALMLCFLCISILFFVSCLDNFSYIKMVGFIITTVLAIYSQYGSVFVAVPLLMLFFWAIIYDKKVVMKQKIILTASYIGSLLVFAAPLYFFFLKIQMEHNEISSHHVEFTVDLLRDLPFTFGSIIGYFFNLNSSDSWTFVIELVGFAMIIISICLFKHDIGKIEKMLIVTLWIAYISHYILVQLHIYAMVHPNQSAGFLARYSYFYIPLLCVVFSVIIYNFKKIYIEKTGEIFKCFCVLFFALTMFISGGTTLKNWNKAYDDQFAIIWLENEGWKDTTYLYGIAQYGFNYYISHSDAYEEGFLSNATSNVNNEELPLRFWAWRTNWGGDGWQTTIDTAKEQGYTVTIYQDNGYAGQLAYCYLE